MNEPIKLMHSTWCLTTGQDLNPRATERIWYELWKLDFTADDVVALVKHVLRFNQKHPNTPMRLAVHKLCGDPELFASLVAEAKALERNRVKPPTPKEQVLEAWRPTNGERVTGANVHRLSDFLKQPTQ